MKILFFDGTAMVIFYKRFDSPVVKLPSDAPPGTKQIELDDAILETLLDGIAVEEKPARPIARLRRAGLDGLLLHDADGYLLDPKIAARLAEAGERPPA